MQPSELHAPVLAWYGAHRRDLPWRRTRDPDTNVRRVLERIDGRRRAPAELGRRAASLLPPSRAADWNQALMELGATVCAARAPRCHACPVAACRSRGAEPARPRRGGEKRLRFEDTDRWIRGRVVASLSAGSALPEGIAAERLERALAGSSATA